MGDCHLWVENIELTPSYPAAVINTFRARGTVFLKGGGWTAMGFYWAFFFLPAADFFVGVDTFNYRDHDYAILRERYRGEGGHGGRRGGGRGRGLPFVDV